LYRDAHARQPNVNHGVLDFLTQEYARSVSALELASYVYALMACPDYSRRFQDGLRIPGPRIPLTRNPLLFEQGVRMGLELIRIQSFASCLKSPGVEFVLSGKARELVPIHMGSYPERFCYDADSQTLTVGCGRIAPVSEALWSFSVSGLQVVRSWLRYRMKKRSGRRSSLLDQLRPRHWTPAMSHELLELLWMLEQSIERFPRLQSWADELLGQALIPGDALPKASPQQCRAPSSKLLLAPMS